MLQLRKVRDVFLDLEKPAGRTCDIVRDTSPCVKPKPSPLGMAYLTRAWLLFCVFSKSTSANIDSPRQMSRVLLYSGK